MNATITTEAVAAVIELHADRDSKLAYVPSVVRWMLGGGHSRQVILDSIMAADLAGAIELRPESGMGRLSCADRSLCPEPAGWPLSWVRSRGASK